MLVEDEEEGGGRRAFRRGVDGNEGVRGPGAELFFLAPALGDGEDFLAAPPDADRGTEFAAGAEVFLEDGEDLAEGGRGHEGEMTNF